jgi:YVTN family beta-propeller protein
MSCHIVSRPFVFAALFGGRQRQSTANGSRAATPAEADSARGWLRRLLTLRRLLQASVLAVGLMGLGAVGAHAQSYTYVTNTDDDTLSLIYTATHEIKNPPVRAIISLRDPANPAEDLGRKYNPVATAVTPYNVAGNANGQYVFTVNRDVGKVSIVDTAKSQLVKVTTVGKEPSAIAISGVRLHPVGGQCHRDNPLWRTYAYVTNSGDGTVSILDANPENVLTFGTRIATVNVGLKPSAIAVSRPTLEELPNNGMFFSAGFYIYVTNSGDNTVSVINADYRTGPDGCGAGNPTDSDFHKNIKTLDLKPAGLNPQGISFERYGRWAYVANAGSDNVTAIDACAQSPKSQGWCTHPFAANHTVGSAIELNKDGTHRAGASPSAVAITIDFTGSHKHQQFRAYIPNPGDDTYSVLDVEAGSPNFQTSIFTCDRNNASDPGHLACPQAGDKPMGVSVMYPDEDFVYFTNYGTNSVLVVDSDPASLGGSGGVAQYNHVVGRIWRGIGSPYPGATTDVNCPPADTGGQRWCGRPLGIANTPRIPYAYVMNSGSKTIDVVGASPQIGDPHPILHTIKLDWSPTWVTLNRNQDFIFVAEKGDPINPNSGRVHVINTMAQLEVGATNAPMGHVLRLATPPDGWSAYASSDNGNVYAVDTVDRSGPGGPGDPFLGGGDLDVSFPIPGTPGFKAIVVDLRKCSTGAAVGCGNPGQGFIADVGAANSLGGLDVHPDTFVGLVANRDADEVVIIDTHYDRTTWNTVRGRISLPTGSAPNAVFFTHKGDRALVLNSNGTVTILNTAGSDYSIQQTIAVGRGAMAAAFAERDLHAYVTNSLDGTVSVIDMTTLTVLAPSQDAPPIADPLIQNWTVQVGLNPQDVFINLGERVAAYVVNTGSNTISIIDDQPPNSTFNTVIHTVQLAPGSAPVGIILTEP